MSERSVLRLSDLATIMTGSTPPASRPDAWGNELDFITPSDQRDNAREARPERRLSADGIRLLANRIVPARSTNLTCIGSTIGKVSMAMREAATNQQINSLVARDGASDSDFLYYLIKGWSPTLKQAASGSATPIVNKTVLSAYEFEVPDVAQQRAIGEVLGALDDKIAANTTLASTAEGLATALFAASVHGVELSDSMFGELAAVRGGGTPRTGVEEYWDGDTNWATPTDVTALRGPYLESTSRRISKQGLDVCASPLYPIGSILMTSRATIGAFAVAQEPTAVNQGFIVVNPHNSSLDWWIFHEMRSRVDEFISFANGATFLELSRGNFKKFRVRLADGSTMKDFGVRAGALHSRARQALVESAKLADTRDLLLPQLMSGRIRVKDAEQMVGEVV